MSTIVYEIERQRGAAPMSLDVGGVLLVFEERVSPTHGGKVVSALIMANAPGAAGVLAWANEQVKRNRLAQVSQATVEREAVAPPLVDVRAGGQPAPPLLVQAALAGWDVPDLIGCGSEPSAAARGGLSGLTLAELAATAPPPGWPERRGLEWPWQVSGWRPPFAGWMPPGLAKPASTWRLVWGDAVEASAPKEPAGEAAGEPATGRERGSRGGGRRAAPAAPAEQVAAEQPAPADLPAPSAEAAAAPSIAAEQPAPADSPAPSAEAGATPTSEDVARFHARVLEASAGEDGPRKQAADLLLQRQSELSPEALTVLLTVTVGSRGTPPVNKLRVALAKAHLPVPNDEILQAVGLLLR